MNGTARMAGVETGGALGGRDGRVGPRAAVVVLAGPPTAAVAQLATALGNEAITDLLDARLLDLVGALLQIEGATISLVAGDQAAVQRLERLVPPSVEAVAAPANVGGGPLSLAGWAVSEGFERAFEHVVVVRETALPLPPHAGTTSLAALAAADLVAGPTPSGDSYLVGARNAQGADTLATLAESTVRAIAQAAAEDGLALHRLEERRALEPGRGLDALAGEIERLGDLAPHLQRWLAAHRRRG